MSSDSGAEREKLRREKDLAFFGAITASVSHELNNVISIVYQTAGLLSDLLAGARRGRPISDERLEQIAIRIGEQTERGAAVIKRLNAFAHSVDQPCAEFEVNAVAENLITLAQRLASLKRVSLAAELAEQPVLLTGSPFGLQQVLFATIRLLLSQSQENDTMTISSDQNDRGVILTVEGRSSDDDRDPDLGGLEFLMSCMNGTIEARTKGGHTTLSLLFNSSAETQGRQDTN